MEDVLSVVVSLCTRSCQLTMREVCTSTRHASDALVRSECLPQFEELMRAMRISTCSKKYEHRCLMQMYFGSRTATLHRYRCGTCGAQVAEVGCCCAPVAEVQEQEEHVEQEEHEEQQQQEGSCFGAPAAEAASCCTAQANLDVWSSFWRVFLGPLISACALAPLCVWSRLT